MKLTDSFEAVAGTYIITNLLNGKIYVGESTNIKKRLYEHRLQHRLIIQLAIQKYGIENFEVYVEYLPNFSKNDLWDLEEQLIIKFNSLSPNGYNLCSRGSGVTGLIMSSAAKAKMSEKSYNKGKIGALSSLSKEVFVYSIEGQYIKSYVGYSEAARELNTTHSVISSVISGKTQQSKGLIFRDSFLGKTIPPLLNSQKRLRRRKVLHFDTDGVIMNSFNSVSSAASSVGLSRTMIRNYCKNPTNNEWCYTN